MRSPYAVSTVAAPTIRSSSNTSYTNLQQRTAAPLAAVYVTRHTHALLKPVKLPAQHTAQPKHTYTQTKALITNTIATYLLQAVQVRSQHGTYRQGMTE